MRPSQVQNTIELTSSQMLTMTIESLIKHFNLVVNDYKLSTGDTQIDAFSPDHAGDFKNHDHFALVSASFVQIVVQTAKSAKKRNF